jgi:hypothetical protein
MNKKELAAGYGISVPTLNKWLKPYEKRIKKRNGYNYNPKQLAIIFSIFGEPKPKNHKKSDIM